MYRSATLSAILATAACLLASHEATPQASQDPRAEIKTAIDFGNLPGKGGPLKPGFIFRQSDYPGLNGFAKNRDTVRMPEGPNGRAVRVLRFTKGQESVILKIVPSQASTDDAHEALVNSFFMQAPIQDSFIRGDMNSIALGDFNFVNADAIANGVSEIFMVRNNILVSGGKDSSTIDLVQLFRTIDSNIQSAVNFTVAQLQTQLPTIATFSPRNERITVRNSTPIDFAASDPRGEQLSFEFLADLGSIGRNETVAPATTTYLAGTVVGVDSLSVTALNESLLFRTATTTVEVIAE